MASENNDNRNGDLIPEDARGDLAKKAFGEAATNFGKEVAPLGQEVGSLTVRSVRLLMQPLKGVVWGGEKIMEWLETAVGEKLKAVPEEKRAEPDPRIALPAVQALVYTGNDEKIRDMFANLISADMNSDTKADTHPAFVELIKEMTATEARVLKYIYDNGAQVCFIQRRSDKGKSGYVEIGKKYTIDVARGSVKDLERGVYNLSRLGLLEVAEGKWPISDEFIKKEENFKNNETLVKLREEAKEHFDFSIAKRGIFLTPLGQSFVKVCLPTQ